jgi:hypothetical protein
MRLKSELYKKEQEEIVDKIIKILDLENKKSYTLYELDNNLEIQNRIMELIPEIRKWYSFNNMKAVGEPKKRKRPWLSIIKNLITLKYNITIKKYTTKPLNKQLPIIQTMKYDFTYKDL